MGAARVSPSSLLGHTAIILGVQVTLEKSQRQAEYLWRHVNTFLIRVQICEMLPSAIASSKKHLVTSNNTVAASSVWLSLPLKTHTNRVLKTTISTFPRLKTMAVVPLFMHHSRRYLVILMLFSTQHCPSLSVDLLDVRLFSETLSKLATDGLGVSALQVMN